LEQHVNMDCFSELAL